MKTGFAWWEKCWKDIVDNTPMREHFSKVSVDGETLKRGNA